MILGVLITIIAMLVSPNSSFHNVLNFNDKLFFTFILPPIIFAAVYNLKRVTFFKYFIYISPIQNVNTNETVYLAKVLTNKPENVFNNTEDYYGDDNTNLFNVNSTKENNNTVGNNGIITFSLRIITLCKCHKCN